MGTYSYQEGRIEKAGEEMEKDESSRMRDDKRECKDPCPTRHRTSSMVKPRSECRDRLERK